ncbi:MAG: DUF3820 family protein [Chitinophagales bacterium]|nr:DUF3820 family protein [Chitinophagales bacterium]
MDPMQPNPDILVQLVRMKMPFGKYKDRLLCDLPVSYLEWFKREGFPQNKLGQLLETMYEIRLNGLEDLLTPLKKAYPKN